MRLKPITEPWYVQALDRLREHLAHAEALLPLALVGLISGLLTGAVVIAFRWLTEHAQIMLTPIAGPEAFEGLPWSYRLALPIAGGLLIGVIFQRASVGSREVGVVHVMERLAYHSGRMPWKNAALQFFGAALSIMSGHSVGREGPVVHVGAASSSLLGQWLGFPNNSIRVLVACGAAASIAASFNTPIAGVIFAMEVVLMEYTLVGFTPVILAAVAATSLARVAYGPAPAFDIPIMQMTSLWELPYILLVGVLVGAAAALFIQGIRSLDVCCREIPLWMRTTAAGLVTGLCGLIAPEVMGIGYDTVELTLLGEMALGALVTVAAVKLVATVACISLGLPGGLIGPTLVMGAAAGGALGVVGHAMVPDMSSSEGFFAMLGMGAMMGATLQAPLAALMAVLELTANSNSILPGMFAIVTATLTTHVLFKKRSVYINMLQARGLDYRNDPVAVSLRRTGVGAIMERRLLALPRRIDASALPQPEPPAEWALLTEDDRVSAVLPWDALEKFMADFVAGKEISEELDLLEIQGAQQAFDMVRIHATLAEAIERMDRSGAQVVLVTGSDHPVPGNVYGVLTRDRIEAGVRYRT
ncbi:MAG: chloride channel protein [Gammaproteobacteria bacterium]|nr:chloride channel protein [Gammaproteobacteria bacterium]